MNPSNNFVHAAIMIAFRILIGSLTAIEVLGANGWIRYSPDYTWFGLSFVSIACWITTEWAYRHREDSARFVPLLMLLAVVSDAFGDVFHLYSSVPHYDKYLHFFNSAILTYLIYMVGRKAFAGANVPIAIQGMVLGCIGSTLGALYEIEEYLEDVLINHRQLRLGDSFDTGWDLLMDITGSFLAALLIFGYLAYRKNSMSAVLQPFATNAPSTSTMLTARQKEK